MVGIMGNYSSLSSNNAIAVVVLALLQHATLVVPQRNNSNYRQTRIGAMDDSAAVGGYALELETQSNSSRRKPPRKLLRQRQQELVNNNDGDSHGNDGGSSRIEFLQSEWSSNPTHPQHHQSNNNHNRKLGVSCGNNGWHPEIYSKKQDGCSNDDHYPAEWVADASLKANMFHGSAAACCTFFFGSGAGCEVYDRCGGSGGGSSVSGGGGSSSASSKDCAWHPDIKTQAGCTNDDNYPQEWTKGLMKTHMFHTTIQGCCKTLFPNGNGDCPSIDRGCTKNVLAGSGSTGTITTSDAGTTSGGEVVKNGDCKTAGWHPDMVSQKGCTNDDNYPAEWLKDEQISSTMFFFTSQECCNFVSANDPNSCQVINAGCTIDPSLTAGECNPNIWHPDTRTRTGCSNTKNYPQDWNTESMKKDFIFKSAMDCCTRYHLGGVCPTRDGCTGVSKTIQITEKPTRSPTKPPTPHPTQYPTTSPTPEPSSSPTVKPPEFYIKHGVGICLNDKYTSMPYYITQTFDSHRKCCMASWAREHCLEDMEIMEEIMANWGNPTGEPVPTQGPKPTPVPSPAPISDVIVEINMYGTLQIENLPTPQGVPTSNDKEWNTLKNVLMSTISSVMSNYCDICHPGLSVQLITYGGQGFPYWRQRTRRRDRELRDVEGNLLFDKIHDDEMKQRQGGQEQEDQRTLFTASQQLQFEMTIPTKCDDTCQLSLGHLGMLAFNELREYFLQFITTGVFSSTLGAIGMAHGLIDASTSESSESSSAEPEASPRISSGTLSYRTATSSSITWVPTFMPTIAMPTEIPTALPTSIPTELEIITESPTSTPTSDEPTISPTSVCTTLKWHYYTVGEYGGCTNSPDYPALWDTVPSIGSHFLYSTLQECCSANSPEICFVSETCAETETVHCNYQNEIMRYHPTTPNQRMCTNSKNYPEVWNLDSHSDRFLFVNVEDCCEAFYDDGICFVKNVCY